MHKTHIRYLLGAVSDSGMRCNVGGIPLNIAYANDPDPVLLLPSRAAMQHLLNILAVHVSSLGMLCRPNTRKTMCMVVAFSFPQFKLGSSSIQFVNKFRYIEHNYNNSRSKNDNDIEREIRNVCIRTNIAARKLGKCSRDV